jgi:cytochrome c553
VWPRLAGQHADYITKQLADFKKGNRKNPLMSAQAANLSEQDMADLAAYFSQQSPAGDVAAKDSVLLGEHIYRGGNADDGIPACMACHGPNGSGNSAAKFPRLGGQHPEYVAAQLRAYRSGERENDGDSKVMRSIAAHMTDAEIDAIAQYAAGLH